MSLMSPSDFMREALREGQKALPACRPNPPVGCVIVSDGAIISRGFTQPPGQHHAEAMALSLLEEGAERLEVYVTLEPCSFQGRTPSCARTLVKYPVKKVYVSLIDPHPKNQGEGIRILEEAGIPVEVGLLKEEVAAFLSPYLIKEA
ncbi:MAG: bifunctional diaminohydroxyphosphoribosylaminopyrimidine deaminase/5-amino-6-(5-phosphoribosylamino)uracil reductase RibD [Bacteroidota bacterium]